MSMMDWSEFGFEDAHEPYAMPDGSEVLVRIVSVDKSTTDKGQEYYLPRLEIDGEPYSKDFTYFLGLPNKDMSEKMRNRTRWNFMQFCQCFGIDLSTPSSPQDDWPGLEGWVLLGVQETAQYGKQNTIKEFKKPR